MKNELMSIDFIKRLLLQRFDSIRDQFFKGKLIIPIKIISKNIPERNSSTSVIDPPIESEPTTNLSHPEVFSTSKKNSPIIEAHIMEDITITSIKPINKIQIDEENILIPSPLADIECVCCKLQGDHKVNNTYQLFLV